MSTELMIYDRIADPLAAIKQLGNSIALSKMFGCENVAQGEVFAMEVLARRTPALMLAERYNVIHNRLSMKSEAMLAGLIELGGKHKMIRRTADAAEVELTYAGETQRFALTWEEAAKEPFVYNGKESDVCDALAAGGKLSIKPKYRTPRSRMQMLWARVVSDGVRVVCPVVVSGTYTPEEIEDFSGVAVNGSPASDEVIDVEYTVDDQVVSGDPAPDDLPTDAPVAAAVKPVNGACSAKQSTRIKELWGMLGATIEQRETMLKKRHAASVRSLTADDADELILRLAEKAALICPEKLQPATESARPRTTMSDAEVVERIKLRLGEIEQVHPGTVDKIKAKLVQSGLKKIADLPREDLMALHSAVDGNDLEGFLGIAIWPNPQAVARASGEISF